MAASFFNPNGAVQLFDCGNPRVFTVKARATISGGWWVNGSSAQSVVGSGIDTYVAGDIEGYPVATEIGSEVIGLALQTIPSGTYGPVAMGGVYLLPVASGLAIGSLYAGWPVVAGSAGTVMAYCSGTKFLTCIAGAVGPMDWKVGKALTTGDTGGNFVVVSVNI